MAIEATERQLEGIIEKMRSEGKLFNDKYLTVKLLAEFFDIEENTVKNYLKKEAGPNGHPKMFGNDYIKSHNEGWGHGNLIVVDPKDAMEFYVKHKDKIGRKFKMDKTPSYYYIESEKQDQEVKAQTQGEENHEKKQGNLNQNQPVLDETRLIEILKKALGERGEAGNQDLSWYVEELKKQIEDIKTEKSEQKKELEAKLEKVELELKEETKRVEKVYFISDRFDKVLNQHKNMMYEIIKMSKSLSAGEQVKLGEIKRLISGLSMNEKIDISESGDIKLLEDRESRDIYNQIQDIPEDIMLEKSRGGELKDLKKSLFRSNLLIFILIIIIIISIGIFYYKTH